MTLDLLSNIQDRPGSLLSRRDTRIKALFRTFHAWKLLKKTRRPRVLRMASAYLLSKTWCLVHTFPRIIGTSLMVTTPSRECQSKVPARANWLSLATIFLESPSRRHPYVGYLLPSLFQLILPPKFPCSLVDQVSAFPISEEVLSYFLRPTLVSQIK